MFGTFRECFLGHLKGVTYTVFIHFNISKAFSGLQYGTVFLQVLSLSLSPYLSLFLSLSLSLSLSSFRAATSAYGSSQAKGWIIGAADAGPCHRHSKTMLDLSHICNLHHSLGQHWILNPLREARDWTQVFVDTSQVRNFWATMRTATLLSFILFGNYSVYSTLTLAEKMRWEQFKANHGEL